ncbi:HVA22-like protein i isoform X1 [Oryza brachyantha]|uniref:HVA22-like protein i isoform X1 n=1 Tax=Oryza brachyantha TaxID=4533 RepID=UPI001ADAEFC4|nr:HVA22-like protein i isoform X1 [Oryza brachyantha]
MAVSFVTGLLTLILGYAYPAYDCYKTLELNKPQIDQLRFWCQYWILLAFLTTLERITDFTVSWLPIYGEAKLALVLYLWYPKTRGAKHVYESYLQPLLARHEADIDRGLLELRGRAKDATASHLRAAASFGRACFADVTGRVSSQLQAASSGGRPGQVEKRPEINPEEEEEEEDEDATVSKTR